MRRYESIRKIMGDLTKSVTINDAIFGILISITLGIASWTLKETVQIKENHAALKVSVPHVERLMSRVEDIDKDVASIPWIVERIKRFEAKLDRIEDKMDVLKERTKRE